MPNETKSWQDASCYSCFLLQNENKALASKTTPNQ